MSLCVDFETSVLDAVDESAREVFDMMANVPLLPKVGCSENEAYDSEHANTPAMTVVLGWTGDLQGSISLSLSEEAAIFWTNSLVSPPSTSVDQNVIDAVGELGNMVVGGAKRRMSAHQMSMSLPSVFRTGQCSLVFPSRTIPLRAYYEFAGHHVTVIVALNKSTKKR